MNWFGNFLSRSTLLFAPLLPASAAAMGSLRQAPSPHSSAFATVAVVLIAVPIGAILPLSSSWIESPGKVLKRINFYTFAAIFSKSIHVKVAVIGGGAAGFFAAISVRQHHPEAEITLFEKSSKLLSKVKVSGGGRCNVTNACTENRLLLEAYPRGRKLMKRVLRQFSTSDTIKWFADKGIRLVAEPDGRMFPQSNSSQTIIDCLLGCAKEMGIQILLQSRIDRISTVQGSILLEGKNLETRTDKVIVAAGGSPKAQGLAWLAEIGHRIEPPVPSLFTFNMPKESIRELMGLVAPSVSVTVQGTKLKSEGPLLLTHWGMSGPAILKLSAFGARILEEMNYEFSVQVNWLQQANQQVVLEDFKARLNQHPKRQIANNRFEELPQRLWEFLLAKAAIPAEKRGLDLSRKDINRLVTLLCNDVFQVQGKTTFKEEFVTCGGISISSVDVETMQSKVFPNLYFAGEILDVDGITGGYNFQAAWATGFVAGKLSSG